MLSTGQVNLWAVRSIIPILYIIHSIAADCEGPPIYDDKIHTNYESTYQTGDTAIYTCAPGYDVQSGATNKTSTCQANGSWSSISLTCSPGTCPSISAPAHGTMSSYDFRVGQQVQFTCDTGYDLQGDSTTTCLTDRTWSQVIPTCTTVICPTLSSLLNGHLSTTDNTYGTMVIYTCTTGYVYSESSSTRQCQADGTWSGVNGQCNEIDCGEPKIDLGSYQLSGGTTYAASAIFSCNPGTLRVPSRDEMSHCNAGQEWDPPPPTCYASCSAPVVENALPTTLGSSSQHNTVVTINCQSGYEIDDGQSSLTCSNGTWIPETLTCVHAPTEASVTTELSTQEVLPPQTPTVAPSEAPRVSWSPSTQSSMGITTSIDDQTESTVILDGTDRPTNGTSDLMNQRKLWFVVIGSLCIAVLPIAFASMGYIRSLKSNKEKRS